jgi:hypothetical protein
VINRVSKPLLIIKQKTKNTKTKENIIKNTKTKENIIKNHQKSSKIIKKYQKNIIKKKEKKFSY